MKCFKSFTAIIAALGATCIVSLTAPNACLAQSDSVNIYTDQGGYYGNGYNGGYYAPTYSRRSYGYSTRYTTPYYSYGSAYGFGNAGPFNYQMGPNVTAINGPFGYSYGPYTYSYYGSNGMPMTYYGPYGFRGFDW